MKEDKSYQIIFKQDFNADKVFLTEVPSSRKIDPILERCARDNWEKQLVQAENAGKRMWDSCLYRFENACVNGELFLEVGTINFSTRIGMNDCTPRVAELGSGYAPLGMFTSCFVVTSDKRYVFIEKSVKFQSNRKFSFVGGVLSKYENTLNSGKELFGMVEAELAEEIGVKKEYISEIVLKAGYITENYNFCLLFETHLTVSSKDLKGMFEKENDGEAEKLIFVSREKLSGFAHRLPSRDLPKFKMLGLIS